MSSKTIHTVAIAALALTATMKAQISQPVVRCGGAAMYTVSNGATANGYGSNASDAEAAAEENLKFKLLMAWGGVQECQPVCPEPNMTPCSPLIQISYQAGIQTTTPGVKVNEHPPEYKATASVEPLAIVTFACRVCS